jgi:hypothetical protein
VPARLDKHLPGEQDQKDDCGYRQRPLGTPLPSLQPVLGVHAAKYRRCFHSETTEMRKSCPPTY